jgi:hypothetical protein
VSDTVTITGVSPDPTIYGTLAEAVAYITAMYGDQYTAWLALSSDNRNRTLVAAARYLDRQVWIDDYDTFAKRDALAAFKTASYELAALIADDPSVISVTDQGSNIARVYAGGAGVDYFNPTSASDGSAPVLPPVIQQLLGAYLAGSTAGTGSPWGQSGACVNPMSACRDDGRDGPF